MAVANWPEPGDLVIAAATLMTPEVRLVAVPAFATPAGGAVTAAAVVPPAALAAPAAPAAPVAHAAPAVPAAPAAPAAPGAPGAPGTVALTDPGVTTAVAAGGGCVLSPPANAAEMASDTTWDV